MPGPSQWCIELEDIANLRKERIISLEAHNEALKAQEKQNMVIRSAMQSLLIALVADASDHPGMDVSKKHIENAVKLWDLKVEELKTKYKLTLIDKQPETE